MIKSILHTEKLSVGYDNKIVVDGVDVNALKGNMICLLGPNGSGKSTILRTLSGMLSPVKGTVYINESNIKKVVKSSLAKKMSVVLTERLQPGLITAYEVASMGRHPYTGFFGKLKEVDHEIVRNSLKSVNALHLSNRYYSELSDGEKQKVMIARALAQEPELIILDEPTSHLDIRHKVEVVEILNKLCREKGITVIMALHDIDLAIKGCQQVMMVKGGKVVAQGIPEEIVSENVIENLYDISNASYSDLIGNLELKGSENSDIFVIPGGGTGIPIFRGLRRLGYGMDCGILYRNDIDYHIARTITNEIILEKDFEIISDDIYEKAYKSMKSHDIIIDSGFPIGNMNKKNLNLIIQALKSNKTVYTMRKNQELYGEYRDRSIYCNNISQLLLNLEKER
jgi:iron complex transport system ATP-binding protein